MAPQPGQVLEGLDTAELAGVDEAHEQVAHLQQWVLDYLLVRGPDFTLVHDGGSNDDLARGPTNHMLADIRAVAPTLAVIDHVILSHPHRDHVELLPDLFAAYQVRQVWDSGSVMTFAVTGLS